MTRTGVVLVAVTVLLVSFVPLPSFAPSEEDRTRVAAHTVVPPSPGEGGNRSERAEMREVENAMVMNPNPDDLPPGCGEISGERAVTIRAGRAYAEPGEMFGYDTDEVNVAPCTRLTVTFINEDRIRHQWMVHGLPRETYPMGMFSIELTGPGKATATFITPSEPASLLVHCSLPQHEQKGMRAALVVGGGETEEPSPETPSETTASNPGFGVLVWIAGVLLFALVRKRLREDGGRSN